MTRIVVVDNHGQFTHLEQRALRDLGFETDIVDNETPPAEVTADGFVLSGGPDIDRIGRSVEYLESGRPVLGICLGMQLMATALGGTVEPATTVAMPTSRSRSRPTRTRSSARSPRRHGSGPATPTRSTRCPRGSSGPPRAISVASRR